MADEPFVDPYSDASRGDEAVPLPPKDVLAADSGMINVDGGGHGAFSNDRDPISSVMYTDVHGRGGGDNGKKIDFGTMCFVVLLVIIACNAVVCSWHVMREERKELIRGYFAGDSITAKVSETDVSESEVDEEDYYDDREDDDDYRTSSDQECNFSDHAE